MDILLLSLEKNFFERKYSSDRNWLNSILHDDFVECGKSGLLFHKEETANALALCQKNREIVIYNFAYQEIKPDCWLVHYITKNKEGQLFYRTSLWVKEDQMKLRFHQASQLNMDVGLVPY